MRILVDGLCVRNFSGRHVLLGHLRQLAAWTVGRHEFLFLHDRRQSDLAKNLPANVQPVCIDQDLAPWSRRLLWESFALPRRLRQWDVDLVFTTSGMAIARCPAGQVSYGLNPWCMVRAAQRGFLEQRKAAFLRHAYRQAMRKTSAMLYLSRHLQELYRKNAGGATERASQVVYTAIDEETHQAARNNAAKKVPGLILSVSVMAPWKGTDVLVDVLAALRRRGSAAVLRLVGPWSDKRYEALVRKKIQSHRLEDSVAITGGVSKEELHRHYAEASVYCLMSECESFGIPAVEAQAFGAPVVGSSVCAMPEVCGAGGTYGDPRDVENTADMLGRMLDDPDWWKIHSHRAQENAARYRWEFCSRPLLEIISSATSV